MPAYDGWRIAVSGLEVVVAGVKLVITGTIEILNIRKQVDD